MADDFLTHKDLAKALGVSETTIKSYRRKFPGCLPVVSQGKPLRFDSKAMEVCRAIREGFRAGVAVEDLRGRLAQAYAWCAPRPASGPGRGGESGADSGRDAVLADLASAVRGLASAQQGVMERLAALEQRLSVPSPASEKVVRIRTRQGAVERYGLSRMAEPADAEAAPEASPDADFMALPMVIRNDTGDFLGITGSEGHLSIQGFRELMRRKAGAGQPLPVRWKRLDEAWVMHMGGFGNGPDGQTHTLHLERTTTPRGNEVVWLKSLLVADDPMPEAFLHRFLRQLRKDFD